MQSAETVLDVIGKRGAGSAGVERLYRQMFNPQLFLLAYGRIYANKGAMTPGGHRGDRGRDVPGQDRGDHRRAAPRAIPVPASKAASTSRRRTGIKGRSGCRPGRTNSWAR